METTSEVAPPRIFRTVLVASLIAAVFSSAEILAWTENMSGGPTAAVAYRLASEWNRAMSFFGADTPHAVLRTETRALIARKF